MQGRSRSFGSVQILGRSLPSRVGTFMFRVIASHQLEIAEATHHKLQRAGCMANVKSSGWRSDLQRPGIEPRKTVRIVEPAAGPAGQPKW
jgi:hypothetical protein